jgi:hypothetical protein
MWYVLSRFIEISVLFLVTAQMHRSFKAGLVRAPKLRLLLLRHAILSSQWDLTFRAGATSKEVQ